MEIHESYASGYRPCKCKDITLNCYKKTIHDKETFALKQNSKGKIYFKDVAARTRIVWIARCSQCQKLYFSWKTRKQLFESLKKSTIKFIDKIIEEVVGIKS